MKSLSGPYLTLRCLSEVRRVKRSLRTQILLFNIPDNLCVNPSIAFSYCVICCKIKIRINTMNTQYAKQFKSPFQHEVSFKLQE